MARKFNQIFPDELASSAPLNAVAAGTPYSFTGSSAQIAFGTTSPELVLTTPGNWLLFARALLNYNAATFAAVRTATLKLRRTNNTAADVANSAVTAKTSIITTLTFSMIEKNWVVPYTTLRNDDIIQMHGALDVIPSAGSLDVAEASILAVRLP